MPSRSSASGGLLFLFSAILLTGFVALGGGTKQALPVESVLQVVALPALLLGLFAGGQQPLHSDARRCLGLLAAVALVVAVQLIPLPPDVWTELSGREQLAQELQMAGMESIWRPVSVVPEMTLRALLALLPPAAVFVLFCRLEMRQRVMLLKLVIMLAVASILLGLAQLADGPLSPLRWHSVTSTTNAVGPFANRNHLATLLAVSLPISAAWLIVALRRRRSERRMVSLIGAGFVMVLFIIGLAVTRSRAGVLLGGAALLSIAVMVWLHRKRIQAGGSTPLRAKRWLLLVLFVCVIVAMQYGLFDLWGRLRTDPLEDKRWQIAATTAQAIGNYGLLGSGAGTFPAVYASVEPDSQRSEYYVNRAHNDWLEWVLEGGLPLLLVLVPGVFLVARMSLTAMKSRSRSAPWQLAAAAGLGLIALHSLLDYPLRTTAMASLAALLVACLLPEDEPVPRTAPVRGKSPPPAPAPPPSPPPVRQRTQKLESTPEPVPRPDLADWELR